jgi:hypothetical protein
MAIPEAGAGQRNPELPKTSKQSEMLSGSVRKNSRNYTLRPGNSIRSSQIFQFNPPAVSVNLYRL